MTKSLKHLFFDFISNREERPCLKEMLLKDNLERLQYLIYIGLPVTMFHIAFFALNPDLNSPIEIKWKNLIINTHLGLSLTFLVIGFISIQINKKKCRFLKKPYALPHIQFLIFLAAGVLLSSYDQLVTNAINPFIIVCVLSTLVLYIPPYITAVYYLAGYAFMYLVMKDYQTDTNVFLSNMVNGFTSISLAWFLSLTMWRNYLMRFRKDRVIDQQKNELIRQNEDLRTSSNELMAANLTRNKLFSIVSHDLRGPIANLNELIRLMQSGIITDKEFRELLPELSRQTIITSELLENLLNWSKSNLKGDAIKPVRVCLANSTDEAINLYKTQADLQQISLVNNVHKNHCVFADKDMISLVIRNLLSNAIKFSKTGGIVVFGSTKNIANIEFSVTDNGKGISDADIEHVMSDEYFSTPGNRGEKGTGLGLVLCREFIEKNGGAISISSMEGKGTRVSFTLPVGDEEGRENF